jgi:hypothetical protein
VERRRCAAPGERSISRSPAGRRAKPCPAFGHLTVPDRTPRASAAVSLRPTWASSTPSPGTAHTVLAKRALSWSVAGTTRGASRRPGVSAVMWALEPARARLGVTPARAPAPREPGRGVRLSRITGEGSGSWPAGGRRPTCRCTVGQSGGAARRSALPRAGPRGAMKAVGHLERVVPSVRPLGREGNAHGLTSAYSSPLTSDGCRLRVVVTLVDWMARRSSQAPGSEFDRATA